jgi:hypothetical protein
MWGRGAPAPPLPHMAIHVGTSAEMATYEGMMSCLMDSHVGSGGIVHLDIHECLVAMGVGLLGEAHG